MNRMVVPLIGSEAQMSSKADIWTLSAHSSAADFKLTLTSKIVQGIYRLMDLYDHGKHRVYELERHYRTEMAILEVPKPDAAENQAESSPILPRQEQRIVIRMSFTFNSGIVELHQGAGDAPQSKTGLDSGDRPYRLNPHDTFTLPTISLWVDYTGPVTDETAMKARRHKGGRLLVNSVGISVVG